MVVLFGATGTVGAYAALDIIKNGFSVVAVGKRKEDNGFFEARAIPYYSVDIVQKSDFHKLPLNNIWAVVHLAGAIPARMSGYSPQMYIDSIVTGTLNVLDYTIKVGAQRIVFAQSISDVAYLYGSDVPISADSPMKFPLNNDHSIYSICKNAAVHLIEHYHAKFGLQYFILRFPNIYLYHPNPFYFVDGEKKWQSYRYLIQRASHGDSIEIWGNPEIKRDIVYVKDCTQIIVGALSAEVGGGIYNVGTGVGTSLREQIESIVDVFSPPNCRSTLIERPDLPDSPGYVMDINKTVADLGYVPQYDYLSYLKDFRIEREKQTFAQLWGEEKQYF